MATVLSPSVSALEPVGDLNPPDPAVLEYLEVTHRHRALVHSDEDVRWGYRRPVAKLFNVKYDVEWTGQPGEVIEPTRETLLAAAADFRDGFWVDVPYPDVTRRQVA